MSNFIQTIIVKCGDPEQLREIIEQWDRERAMEDITGYMGSKLLADRDRPGEIVIIAEFGVVDPDVSAIEEAERNNERPETQRWAKRLLELIEGDPEYHHYDELYRTG